MNETYPFSVEPLPYSYSEMEPLLNRDVLTFHHDKHYGTYVSNLNAVLEPNQELQDVTLEDLLKRLDSFSPPLKTAIQNNGGGVYNHQLYFETMKSPNFTTPTGSLGTQIEKDFQTFDNFMKTFQDTCIKLFGSGYVWLVKHKERLEILPTQNQNTPISQDMYPCLCIDLWEHAFYLQYQNRKADYINNWFSLINWNAVERRFHS